MPGWCRQTERLCQQFRHTASIWLRKKGKRWLTRSNGASEWHAYNLVYRHKYGSSDNKVVRSLIQEYGLAEDLAVSVCHT